MTGIMRNLVLAGGVAILLWVPSARAEKTCVEKIQDKCTTCHYPTRICLKIGKNSLRDWEVTVKRMLRYGLQLPDGKMDEMLDCLEGLEKDSGNLCQ